MSSTANKDLAILVYKNAEKSFILEGDKNYQIVSKFDANAPDGYQRHRTTKVLDPDADTVTNLAVFDSERGVYDTSLTKYSKALKRIHKNNEDDVQSALLTINKFITKELVNLKGADKIEPSNLDFWDNFSLSINLDQVFNTNDPLQLAQLYFLIIHGKVAPVGLESEPQFQEAQFAVENKETVVDITQKRELQKSKAQNKFMNLLESDRESLNAILDYTGIVGADGADEALVNIIFKNWLDKDENQNPDLFLKNHADFTTSESGKKIISTYKVLRDLERAKKLKRTTGGSILFQDEIIGDNMKKAAENVVKNKDLTDKVYTVFDTID